MSRGKAWRRHALSDEVVRQVAWARDGRTLIIRGSRSLLRWYPAASRPAKLGPTPVTCGDVEVGRYGDLFRCGKTVFDVDGRPKDAPPILRLSRFDADGARPRMSMPSEEPVFIDADPRAGRWSYVGERGLMRAHHGVVKLYHPETTDEVATFVGTADGVIALFDDGRVDAVGSGALEVPGLVCLRGTEVAPWSSCAEAWHDPQAVARCLECR